jgi:hypothetical protein
MRSLAQLESGGRYEREGAGCISTRMTRRTGRREEEARGLGMVQTMRAEGYNTLLLK